MNPLTATPYRSADPYTPEDLISPEASEAFLKEHSEAPVRFRIQGLGIQMFRDPSGDLILFAAKEGAVLYHMVLSTVEMDRASGLPKDILNRGSYQSSVYRSRALKGDYQGFVAEVFWRILSTRRNVLSDSVQSQAGEAFWLSRVFEAKRRSLNVYGVTCAKLGSNRLRIQSAELLVNVAAEWDKWYSSGSDYSGLDRRLLIAGN